MFNTAKFNQIQFNGELVVNYKYSYGGSSVLPSDDKHLNNLYSIQDYIDAKEDDGVRVAGTGNGKYILHQFKDKVDAESINVSWNGQSNSANTIYLQIYNRTSGEWETLDSETPTVNTDLTLVGSKSNLSDYTDGDWVAFRVYQEVS